MSAEDPKQEEFTLISEKIKEKPVSGKTRTRHVMEAVIIGVLIGAVAAVIFFFVNRGLDNAFATTETQETQVMTENDLKMDEVQNLVESEIEDQMGNVDVSDLKVQQKKLYDIGADADSSIVTVTGVKEDDSWFATDYETEGQDCGIILQKTEKKIRIVTQKSVVSGADSIKVTFADGSTASGKLKGYDNNTKLAVVVVNTSNLKQETLKAIKAAKLSSVTGLSRGSIVVAVGSPLGSIGSVEVGSVTQSSREVNCTDRRYHVITTDIVGSSSATGVLLNTDGDVVGFVVQNFAIGSADNILTAVPAAELSDLINAMISGKDIPYIGLKLADVTDDIATQHNLPDGVYVTEVQADSPAADAGIKNGDVITEMGGTEISDMEDYESVLDSCSSGDNISISIMRMNGSGSYEEIDCNVTVSNIE